VRRRKNDDGSDAGDVVAPQEHDTIAAIDTLMIAPPPARELR
jgi:hypothetical protein